MRNKKYVLVFVNVECSRTLYQAIPHKIGQPELSIIVPFMGIACPNCSVSSIKIILILVIIPIVLLNGVKIVLAF